MIRKNRPGDERHDEREEQEDHVERLLHLGHPGRLGGGLGAGQGVGLGGGVVDPGASASA